MTHARQRHRDASSVEGETAEGIDVLGLARIVEAHQHHDEDRHEHVDQDEQPDG